MNKKPIPTLNKDQELALEQIVAELGSSPTMSAIEQFFRDRGVRKANAYCRGIWLHLKAGYAEVYGKFLDAVVQELGENPTVADIEVVAKRLGKPKSQRFYAKVWRDVRKKHPELWIERGNSYLNVRMSQSNADLLKAFSRMVGLPRPETLTLLLRGMLLAGMRNQINFVELVATTKKLKPADIELMKKTLNINLKNL